jgi:hypothetical protein
MSGWVGGMISSFGARGMAALMVLPLSVLAVALGAAP